MIVMMITIQNGRRHFVDELRRRLRNVQTTPNKEKSCCFIQFKLEPPPPPRLSILISLCALKHSLIAISTRFFLFFLLFGGVQVDWTRDA